MEINILITLTFNVQKHKGGGGGVGAVGLGGVLEMVSNTFALFIRAHKT